MKTIISDIIIKANNQVKRIGATSIDLIDQKFKIVDKSEYIYSTSLNNACWVSCDKYYPEVIGVKIGYLDDSGSYGRALLIRTETIELANTIYNELLNNIPKDNTAIVLDIRTYGAELLVFEGNYRYNTDICGPISFHTFCEFFNDQYEEHEDEINKKKEEIHKKNLEELDEEDEPKTNNKPDTNIAIATGIAIFLCFILVVIPIIISHVSNSR